MRAWILVFVWLRLFHGIHGSVSTSTVKPEGEEPAASSNDVLHKRDHQHHKHHVSKLRQIFYSRASVSGCSALLRVHLILMARMFSFAEIRCFCNLPQCASSYMCKSPLGHCFTEVIDVEKPEKTRHGCVEMLEEAEMEPCLLAGDKDDPNLLVKCCREDLCNYVHMDMVLQMKTKPEQGPDAIKPATTTPSDAALQQDLWFKAATIAVPIAGGFILIILVLLAVRMLRKDSKRQRNNVDLERRAYPYPSPYYHQQELLLGDEHVKEPCFYHHHHCHHCCPGESVKNPKVAGVNLQEGNNPYLNDNMGMGSVIRWSGHSSQPPPPSPPASV
ncbi:unnamed protein product [Darwinula stevensoni]|uniref:BMP and activin membrane-bound inhibitor homolog n=1 Tax=Darwinula stevensoni TaxID=69355 RepID=A0A7R9A7S8_9CRUS|nr:unnamed protein product [Darwinula stevensoni]CAG0893285.1 unnamed protein product [Darwinula stevensoni]